MWLSALPPALLHIRPEGIGLATAHGSRKQGHSQDQARSCELLFHYPGRTAGKVGFANLTKTGVLS